MSKPPHPNCLIPNTRIQSAAEIEALIAENASTMPSLRLVGNGTAPKSPPPRQIRRMRERKGPAR